MKKNFYIKPEISILEMTENTSILAGSLNTSADLDITEGLDEGIDADNDGKNDGFGNGEGTGVWE